MAGTARRRRPATATRRATSTRDGVPKVLSYPASAKALASVVAALGMSLISLRWHSLAPVSVGDKQLRK